MDPPSTSPGIAERWRRSPPSIYRLNRNQNPYLRRDLNHPSASRQARSKLTQSPGVDLFHGTRILFPLGASNSITYCSCGAIRSTNAGFERFAP
jgi:hypothetical protein